jgi:hypothetical protein
MTTNDIFKEMLKDPVLITEYGFTEAKLQNISLHEHSETPVLEVIKLLILGNENGTPSQSINVQVKNYFEK